MHKEHWRELGQKKVLRQTSQGTKRLEKKSWNIIKQGRNISKKIKCPKGQIVLVQTSQEQNIPGIHSPGGKMFQGPNIHTVALK
jgi:hypothetical protein